MFHSKQPRPTTTPRHESQSLSEAFFLCDRYPRALEARVVGAIARRLDRNGYAGHQHLPTSLALYADDLRVSGVMAGWYRIFISCACHVAEGHSIDAWAYAWTFAKARTLRSRSKQSLL